MLAKVCLTACFVGLSLLATSQKNCENAKKSSSASVRLQPIAVPARVFSVSGEVLAFKGVGEPGKLQKNKVSVSLEPLRKRFGDFKRANVFEFNSAGKQTSQNSVTVSANAAVAIEATAGSYYLVYAELGKSYSNAYRFGCNVANLKIQSTRLPEICSLILCVDAPLEVAVLGERFPELQELGAFSGLVEGEIANLIRTNESGRPAQTMPMSRISSQGGGCGDCRNIGPNTFVPVGDCSAELPISGDLLPGPIVYDRIFYTTDDVRGSTQIFKLDYGNSEPVNLSRNQNTEFHPDVNPDGQQIVFARAGVGLFIMDINGENVRAVPNTEGASHPKWILNRDAEPYILYIREGDDIHYVRPDGTENTVVTSPGNQLSDVYVDRYDQSNIVFERVDSRRSFDPDIFGNDVFGNGFMDSDLFIKRVWDTDSAPVRLTNTPNTIEALPTGANIDRGLVAYSVFSPSDPACEVRVARLDGDTLTVLQTFRLPMPADWGINGISFSKDDSQLFISTRARDTRNVNQARKYELFIVALDGTHLQRITNNLHMDSHPSAIYTWAAR
jgi:hypothetical protein